MTRFGYAVPRAVIKAGNSIQFGSVIGPPLINGTLISAVLYRNRACPATYCAWVRSCCRPHPLLAAYAKTAFHTYGAGRPENWSSVWPSIRAHVSRVPMSAPASRRTAEETLVVGGETHEVFVRGRSTHSDREASSGAKLSGQNDEGIHTSIFQTGSPDTAERSSVQDSSNPFSETSTSEKVFPQTS